MSHGSLGHREGLGDCQGHGLLGGVHPEAASSQHSAVIQQCNIAAQVARALRNHTTPPFEDICSDHQAVLSADCSGTDCPKQIAFLYAR